MAGQQDVFNQHLATLLGMVAGDRYNPTMPEPPASAGFDEQASLQALTDSWNAQYTKRMEAEAAKQQTDAANIDLSGDPALVAAKAAKAAGFTGEALVNIVAIAGRESGYNPASVGDVKLQDGTWGPSVGLFQIRTLKNQTGSGSSRDINRLTNNPLAQAQAAYELSGGGKDFGPWKLHGGSFLANTDVTRARQIVAMLGG